MAEPRSPRQDEPLDETENPGAPSRPDASEPNELVSTLDDDGNYRTLAHGFLSPRHRRLAQLAASGLSHTKLSEELGYNKSRISVLLRHPLIVEEVRRLQDQIFAETIEKRLKGMSDSALAVIESALRDRSGKTKVGEKIETAKWVIEKVDGKAMQKVDVGSSAIGSFLDRLDALKAAGRSLDSPSRSSELIDVTPGPIPEAVPRTEEDDLSDWVTQFDQDSRK